uniref:hypothetical protein n=1 Tax=Polynucleobacter sp. TaxID=2029855 RepID=UPI0040471F0F
MRPFITRTAIVGSVLLLSLAACSGSKLEARLQANPQCKPIFNAKTGSAMPCPDTEKTLSRGLVQQRADLSTEVAGTQDIALPNNQNISTPANTKTSQLNSTSSECKPFLHQKTGNLIPCPAP